MQIQCEPDRHPASLSYTKYPIMKLMTFFGTGIFIVFAACCIQKEAASKQFPFFDMKWNLKKMHTPSGTDIVNTKAFIKFNKEKGSAGGNGSCNNFGSTITLDGNKVSFSNIFSTKMYCEGIQSIEDAYFKDLQMVNRYEITENRLFLYHGQEILLEFESE
jgi:heat shock protein HslJ